LKSVLFGAAAALALASPLCAETYPPPQPYPMPAPIQPPRDVPYAPGTIRISIDATDLERRIFHIHETVPIAGPGPVTLFYPQWIPGNHGPSGQLKQVASVVFRANGQVLPWKRHPVEVYAYQVVAPAGATAIDVDFDFVSPTATNQGRVVMTPEMLNAQWISLSMYPAGYFTRQIPIQASIRLPAGWGYATALETASNEGGLVQFKTVPYDVFADSPLFAGRYFKTWDLDTSGKSPVRLDVFADRPELLAATPEQIDKHRELIRQADRLYGARHYDHYDLLLALTDRMGGIGLEHHRSSENGTDPDYFTDWESNAPNRNLLPHEYSHSWNGKFRRPADLWTPNFNVPMRDSLLWVYEGQDQ
jgi:predicted metalloprotease with PDZ domain